VLSDQALGERSVLRRKIARQVFQAVVPEVAVKLAVDREFFIVQGFIGRMRAFQVMCRQRLARDFHDGLLDDAVEIWCKDGTTKPSRNESAQNAESEKP
jgi:hypothetical protein